MTKPNN